MVDGLRGGYRTRARCRAARYHNMQYGGSIEPPYVAVGRLVPHTGFEPVISALRGRCPGPLDECGPVGAGVFAGPVGMIPAASRPHQTQPRRRALEPIGLEEPTDRLGDLLEAVLADHEPVMG